MNNTIVLITEDDFNQALTAFCETLPTDPEQDDTNE